MEGDVTSAARAACPAQGSYASEVVSFEPGADAGFGQDELPGVVLGPPGKGSELSGSLDVLSLGVGGQIVLGFSGQSIVDGPGVDLVVFENPFWPGGDSEQVFAELGEVAVSADGDSWTVFPCDAAEGGWAWPGCAGWRPRLEDDACALPMEPAKLGGDGFDLAEIGVAEARYVRIRDLATGGAPPSAGFDLDGVAAIHLN